MLKNQLVILWMFSSCYFLVTLNILSSLTVNCNVPWCETLLLGLG